MSSMRLSINQGFNLHYKRYFFQKFFNPIIEAAQPKEHVVQQLTKPIGLLKPPTNKTIYSKGNTFRDLFDKEKTVRRTEELTLEFGKSGMYEMHTFRKTDGKLFYPPKSYWKSDKSLYFPHIKGHSISKGSKTISIEDKMRGKISIVRIFGSKVGEDITNPYLDIVNPLLNKVTQIIQVSWIENRLKSFIMKLSLRNIRANVPIAYHENYFHCKREQLPFSIRENLQINNLYAGFILLVDPKLKIRWMASGKPSDEDLKNLVRCVKGIQKENTPVNELN